MGEKRNEQKALVVKPEGINHLEDQLVERRIILKCIFRK
jgi:hypothetical protein